MKAALRLAVPIAGAYLVIVMGMLVEFVIVGNILGAAGIGAVGLAGALSLVLVLSFHAMEIAVQATAARRYGAGDKLAAGAVLDNALVFAFVLGIPLTAALYGLGPWIFSTAQNAEVQEMAYQYFRMRLIGMPFVIALLSMIGFFNAISRPTIPAAVYGLILFLNAGLCWVLVKGLFGIPAMGIRGAGLAQSISVVVGFACFIGILLLPKIRKEFGALRFARNFKRAVAKSLGKLAAPVFAQQFFSNFGVYLFVMINSIVPDDGVSLAASTLARNISYLTYLPSLGFGLAAATMIGQSLGAGQARRAEISGYICWKLGVIFMVGIGILFIIFPYQLVDLFLRATSNGNGSDGGVDSFRVFELAAKLLLIVGGYQTFESINTIMGKALQGAGSTLFVMKVSITTQYLFFLPTAYILAIPMGFGAFGAMTALAMQLGLNSFFFMRRYRQGKWKLNKV